MLEELIIVECVNETKPILAKHFYLQKLLLCSAYAHLGL